MHTMANNNPLEATLNCGEQARAGLYYVAQSGFYTMNVHVFGNEAKYKYSKRSVSKLCIPETDTPKP